MIGYSANEVFSQNSQQLLALATLIVSSFPEIDDAGELIRCHEVARAVGEILQLEVVDGRYGMVEHSWLELSRGRILDVYAMGRLPPVQLVMSSALTIPEYQAHKAGTPRDDIRADVVGKLIETARAFLQNGRAA